MKLTNRKNGFTLVELLVVIAIIGILIGMLLPAVQQVREAARRSACTNNLKQLTLGLLNFESARSEFPPGYGFNDIASGGGWTKAWGWGARILPYIEQNSIYDLLEVGANEFNETFPNGDFASWDPNKVAAMQAGGDVFKCPSDAEWNPVNITTDFHSGSFPDTHKPGTSNYIGVYGYQYSSWSAPAEPPRNEGMFQPQNGTTLQEATDGTSNTFFVGERDTAHHAGYWVGVGNVLSESSWSSPKVVGRTFMLKPNLPLVSRFYSAFSSEHTGGLNFSFADGSVHFISEAIDFSDGFTNSGSPHHWSNTFDDMDSSTFGTYQKLGCKADGAVVSDF